MPWIYVYNINVSFVVCLNLHFFTETYINMWLFCRSLLLFAFFRSLSYVQLLSCSPTFQTSKIEVQVENNMLLFSCNSKDLL